MMFLFLYVTVIASSAHKLGLYLTKNIYTVSQKDAASVTRIDSIPVTLAEYNTVQL